MKNLPEKKYSQFVQKQIGRIVFGILYLVIAVVLFSLLTTHYPLLTVKGDEIEDLQKQIEQLNKARQDSISATKPLEGQLTNLKNQLLQIQNNLSLLARKIVQKEDDLNIRTEKIAEQQLLLENRVRS